MKYIFLYVSFLLLSANTLFAQVATEFPIRILGGTDTNPPTTPVLLTIEPAAPTQIDISWSVSTDNLLVAGYSVLRDGTPIATTTLLSYSDTGLVASTTYAYVVRAFDPSLNYSTTSNSLATTTPDFPDPPLVPTTTSEREGGTVSRIVVKDFHLNEGVSTSSIHLDTVQPARVEVRWGRTASYELGYVVSSIYRKEHAILLTDLEPGTTYEYQVIGYTPYGKQSIIRSGDFTTQRESLSVSPVNVSHFQAVKNGDDIDLSWKLPLDDTISNVRIVRSHLGFPEHPQDGAVLYQGLKEVFRDEDILSQYSPVYYTAFVYDSEGNVSSGAVVLVYSTQSADDEGVNSGTILPIPNPPIVVTGATTSINLDRVTVEMKMPQPSDIAITQRHNSYSLLNTDITLASEQAFLISIPRTTIAGNLKSIIVTLLDPTNNKKAYSYLLRINQDQTAYSATVPAFLVEGRSQIKVEIYDFEAFVVVTYQTPLSFAYSLNSRAKEVMFPDSIYNNYILWSMVPLSLIVLLILIFLSHRGQVRITAGKKI
ncbi:MAG: chitodextrinase [Candidatus Paceibacteria bacterium]|jgi:chitodextrinase